MTHYAHIEIYQCSLYIIGESMSDSQNSLDLQNICHLTTKKLKVTAIQNVLLKVKLKNRKEKCVNGLMMIKVCIFVKILLMI